MRAIKRTALLSLITPLCLTTTLLQARDKQTSSYQGLKEENLHIYLLIGQSNMSGRDKFTKEQAGVIARAYLLNDEEQWEPAKNGLNRYSSIRKKARQGINAGYSFAKTMLEEDKDVNVGLVVNARGGTKIQQWKKGGEYYNEAIRRVKEAEKTGTLKGILWHQGESNSKDVDTYLDMLVELIKDFREDLGKPNLPFIAGQLAGGKDGISLEIAKLPETLPYTGVASGKGITVNPKIRHIDNKSMLLLGKRYAAEMMKAQKKLNE